MNLLLISLLCLFFSSTISSTFLFSDLTSSLDGYHYLYNPTFAVEQYFTCSGSNYISFKPSIFKLYNLSLPANEPLLQINIQLAAINMLDGEIVSILLNKSLKATITYTHMSQHPLKPLCNEASNSFEINVTILQNYSVGPHIISLELEPTVLFNSNIEFGIRNIEFKSLGLNEAPHPGSIDWRDGYTGWFLENFTVQENRCDSKVGRISNGPADTFKKYVNVYMPSVYVGLGLNYRIYSKMKVFKDGEGVLLVDSEYRELAFTSGREMNYLGKENPCFGEILEPKYFGENVILEKNGMFFENNLRMYSPMTDKNVYYVTRFEMFGVTEAYSKTTLLPYHGVNKFQDYGFVDRDRRNPVISSSGDLIYLEIPMREAIYKTFYLSPQKGGILISAELITRLDDRDYASMDILINGRKLVSYEGPKDFSTKTALGYICKAAFFVEVNTGPRYALVIAIKDSTYKTLSYSTYAGYGIGNIKIQEVEEDFLSQPGVRLDGAKVHWNATLNLPRTSNTNNNSSAHSNDGSNPNGPNNTYNTTIIIQTYIEAIDGKVWQYILISFGVILVPTLIFIYFYKKKTRRPQVNIILPVVVQRAQALPVYAVQGVPFNPPENSRDHIIETAQPYVANFRSESSVINLSASFAESEAVSTSQIQLDSSVLESRLDA